ncbi:MAG TPA: hypothetical protein VF642_12365 [Propionibacteriaceae bacterium]|jgi:hypothetical protein
MSDVPTLGDRERIARVLWGHQMVDRPDRVCCCGWDVPARYWSVRVGRFVNHQAAAVLAVLPSPAVYVRALADDEELVERTCETYRALTGMNYPLPRVIAAMIRALAAALPTERTDR